MKKFSKNEWLTLIVGLVLVVLFLWLGGFFRLFNINNAQNMNNSKGSGLPAVSGTNTSKDSNLQIIDVAVGTGTVATQGSSVTVNYTGMLQDGTVFDSSISRNTPFTFKLGNGDVIKGWDLGLVGMKVGGKRRLVIAPSYGYGAQDVTNPSTGQVVIPANSTLVFDVELVSVK